MPPSAGSLEVDIAADRITTTACDFRMRTGLPDSALVDRLDRPLLAGRYVLFAGEIDDFASTDRLPGADST